MGSGFRFTGIDIPYGATITQAYLVFTAYTSFNTGVIVNTVIQGELSLSPQSFSTYTDFAVRPRTSQIVYWQNIPAWLPDATYQSPDISQVIQAQVNQLGWQSGNNLVLFWGDTAGQGNTTAHIARYAYSYSQSPSQAVGLYIAYDANPYAPSPSSDYTTDMASLKSGVSDLQKTVTSVSNSIDSLGKQYNMVSGKIDGVTASTTSTQALIQSLQSTVNSLQTTTAPTNGSIVALGAQIKTVSDTLTTLTANLNSVKTDVAALTKQSADSAIKVAGNDVRLQSKIGGLQAWIVVLLVAQIITLLLLFVLLGRRMGCASVDNNVVALTPKPPAPASKPPAPKAKSK
jgi:hypothetical protein